MAPRFDGRSADAALGSRDLGDALSRKPAAACLQEVSAGYAAVPTIEQISGSFEQGTLTAIVGPNGAGKSTLMKTIAGALRPSRGSIVLSDGKPSYLPQRSAVDQSFPITVMDTVLLGHCRRRGWYRSFNAADRDAAAEAIARVNMSSMAGQPIATLSAGQFQRTLFARLIVEDAPMILLDEPFNAIDVGTTQILLDLVVQWHSEGRTVLAVLHDLEQIRRYFPETLLLARRLVDWGETQTVLTRENLDQAYRQAASWDAGDLRSTPPSAP